MASTSLRPACWPSRPARTRSRTTSRTPPRPATRPTAPPSAPSASCCSRTRAAAAASARSASARRSRRQVTDLAPRRVRETGEPLDLAIDGEGFFAVQTDAGRALHAQRPLHGRRRGGTLDRPARQRRARPERPARSGPLPTAPSRPASVGVFALTDARQGRRRPVHRRRRRPGHRHRAAPAPSRARASTRPARWSR